MTLYLKVFQFLIFFSSFEVHSSFSQNTDSWCTFTVNESFNIFLQVLGSFSCVKRSEAGGFALSNFKLVVYV
jgi:hypothetical protein